MEAGTLNCPECGAAVASDSSQCQYCGAKLATVACPSCFAMAFVGSKFCPHCGAELDWSGDIARVKQMCPRCRVRFEEVKLGSVMVNECPQCCGLWVNTKTFEKICAEREEQAAVLGAKLGPAKSVDPEAHLRYLPCPQCHQLMNRMNFAHRSGVVVDICKPHGVWFDRDELQRIVEFIRAGGLDHAREEEIEKLEYERERLHETQQAAEAESLLSAKDHGSLLTAIALMGHVY